MRTPNFSPSQFVDATAPGGLNPAFAVVAEAFSSLGSGAWAVPGLVAPEAMTTSFSGMVATVGLPAPWGLISSGGLVVRAHGTQTAQDTQTYTVDFTSLIPATGSLTAYLAATVTSIQQNPFPIPGPPPGTVAYDPNFVPTVGYAANVYTVALSAVTGVPDNTTTFGLLSTVLVAGQSAVTGYTTGVQRRAGSTKAWPYALLTSGGSLAPWQAQTMLVPTTSGLTHTLPPTSGAIDLMFGYINTTGGSCTLAAAGSDLIGGIASGTTYSSITVPSTAGLLAYAFSGIWQIVAASPSLRPVYVFAPIIVTGSAAGGSNITGSGTVPAGATFMDVDLVAAGGPGAGADGTYNGGSGGAGGTVRKRFLNPTIGATYNYVLGATGQGGAPSASGSPSAASTFTFAATTLTANPGISGLHAASPSGGDGGTATGGDENIKGGAGADGPLAGTSAGGVAGASTEGGGGRSATTTSSLQTGVAYGSGGGGSYGAGSITGGDPAAARLKIQFG